MKKKILFLMIFLVTAIFIGINIKGSEAKAEETCTITTNYYLFQDGSKYYNFKNPSSPPALRTTTKNFALPVPANAEILDEGELNFTTGSDTSYYLDGKMSTATFYDLTGNPSRIRGDIKKTTDPDGKEIRSWVYCTDATDSKGKVCFTTSKIWEEGNSIKTGFVDSPSTWEAWEKQLIHSFNSSETKIVNADSSNSNFFRASITRTYNTSTLQALQGKGFTDETVLYSIGGYYVEYKVCTGSSDPEPPVTKENKVTTHYYIENTTTKLHDDKVDYNQTGTYTSNCPETLSKDGKYYDRLKASVSVEMPEEGEEELVCYYKEQTYSMTISYGEDEDCTKLLQDSVYKDGLKAGESMSIDVPNSIGSMTRPTLGTYSSQIVNKPELNGTNLTFVMPAKDVNICIVYTPQTGSSMVKWLALIGLGALAFTVWNISKKNNEANNEA